MGAKSMEIRCPTRGMRRRKVLPLLTSLDSFLHENETYSKFCNVENIGNQDNDYIFASTKKCGNCNREFAKEVMKDIFCCNPMARFFHCCFKSDDDYKSITPRSASKLSATSLNKKSSIRKGHYNSHYMPRSKRDTIKIRDIKYDIPNDSKMKNASEDMKEEGIDK